MHFGKSDADKLREQLKKTERQAENFKQWYEAEIGDHEHTKKRLSATKGVLTRTKNRIHNGVCPCCKRHFTNLERHMNTKHPDYSTEDNPQSA